MDNIEASKLRKAEEFLISAELMQECGSLNAAVSLAVSASINASDAIIFGVSGRLPSGVDHNSAVTALKKASDASAWIQLQRALNLKNKAQYSAVSCTSTDAENAIKAAQRLVEKARQRKGLHEHPHSG
ncbi:HEPN domain-containing protein [uncultured Plantibacter sp.]|uniref:HEPN domain-containing protein n=1 Tax=uncultured Plantibacter sp. TaxID=293337 RepID=UPI0028D14346|nr:HEPN domain-containing protein [uncultured Plantibacter sp.]